MRSFPLRLIALAFVAAGICAHADSYHVIVCGSGGEPEFINRFADWGRRLQTALIDVARTEPDRVLLLTEAEQNATRDTSQTGLPAALGPSACHSDLESIRTTLHELETSLDEDDDVFVYLIGHGSHRRDEAKFIIPGPDLTAAELGSLLGGLSAKNRIVINGTSSSAGFINVLGPRDIIVCTATKSVEQRNATEFMGYFIQAIEEGTADEDHDGRMSVYEVCSRAATLTATWYENEDLIASEHALLEDNSDGLGTRLPVESDAQESTLDGERAKEIFIKTHDYPANVPNELIQEYDAALKTIEELKQAKGDLSESEYYEKLEARLVRAARANRAIRDAVPDLENSD